jgi:hypothetical protein
MTTFAENVSEIEKTSRRASGSLLIAARNRLVAVGPLMMLGGGIVLTVAWTGGLLWLSLRLVLLAV